MHLKHKERFVQGMERVLRLIKYVKSSSWSFVLEISHWTMLRGRVGQVKLIVIKSRHDLRTIKVLPHGRQPTCSKYPNQYSYWWKWKMCLLFYGNKLNRHFGQPNTRPLTWERMTQMRDGFPLRFWVDVVTDQEAVTLWRMVISEPAAVGHQRPSLWDASGTALRKHCI